MKNSPLSESRLRAKQGLLYAQSLRNHWIVRRDDTAGPVTGQVWVSARKNRELPLISIHTAALETQSLKSVPAVRQLPP
jgi:hypothetical protein